MGKYTKGKLDILVDTNYNSYTFIRGGDGGKIADAFCIWREREESNANAERLVSCWNACLNLENPESDLPKIIESLRKAYLFHSKNWNKDFCEEVKQVLDLVKE